MEINILSVILLAILHVLPNSVKHFTVQTPDKQMVEFERKDDGFWYAPKAQGEMFNGIEAKGGKLLSKTGEVILDEKYLFEKTSPVRWKEVTLIQEGNSSMQIVKKKNSITIHLNDSNRDKSTAKTFKISNIRDK